MPVPAHTPPPLILASSSPYRARMLDRLGLPFSTATSGIDETAEPGETPEALVRRLALGKAQHIAPRHPEALVIGADQVSVLGDEILGKPGSRERAICQIQRMSGKRVDYLSGIALVGPGIEQVDIVPTRLTYRTLEQTEIERYVDRDQPFDCAGAMRSESLGIALLESLASDDPTALIGMPLIRIAQWLRAAGYEIP
ncbi:MAG TPA: nucleoside triphosphate pyrophosphatase [Wenzhouxiangellaceae bacterium]|nr:nucleoside triphosphate pyrophosphatase [Wenzhouxiangellaceae bacterium]